MDKRFQRTVEDFTCEHCGAAVSGNGYTNHCPHCLWSRHVDDNPGDRAAACRGMMKPVAVQVTGQETFLHHRCKECGLERRIRTSPQDDYEAILDLARGVIR